MAYSESGLSYNYANEIRDVNEDFDITRSEMPILLSAIQSAGAATATKHEWGEDTLEQVKSAIGTVTSQTVFIVADGSRFKVGMVLGGEKANGISISEQVKITGISSNTLTVTGTYGGTTPYTFVVGDILFVISRPQNEGTESETGDSWESGLAFNYTEIYDVTAQVTETSQNVKMYGPSKALEMATMVKLDELARKQNNSLIYGRKVARSASEAGSAGGVIQFIEDGGLADGTGGAISSTILNNLFELVLSKGALSNNFAFLCSYNQARRISAFNTSGTNPVVQVAQGSRVTGEAISQFNGDIPAMGGSFQAKIFTDPNFPKDKIALIDLNRIKIKPLRAIVDKDATPNGADFIRRRIIGESTWEIKNAGSSMAMANGLTV